MCWASCLTQPSRPAEACVIMSIIFELIRLNPTFCQVLLEGTSERNGGNDPLPFPFALLTLSSYLFAHATSSPRAAAYANLALHVLLAMVEKDDVLTMLCQPSSLEIRVCRQVRSRPIVTLNVRANTSVQEASGAPDTAFASGPCVCTAGWLCALAPP
jgi:hypothetical protein